MPSPDDSPSSGTSRHSDNVRLSNGSFSGSNSVRIITEQDSGRSSRVSNNSLSPVDENFPSLDESSSEPQARDVCSIQTKISGLSRITTLQRVDEDEELKFAGESQDFESMKRAVSSRVSSVSNGMDDTRGGSAAFCGMCRRRRKAPGFLQTLVVMRHSERRDFTDPTYKESDEGKQWPHDTPLTAKGVTWARKVGRELKVLHKKVDFAAIASSPYRRCMTTAAELAKEMDLPIIIDQELMEVWDETMPHDRFPHRSPLELMEMAKSLQIQVANPILPEGGYKLFGQPPKTWPESLESGHKRFLVRIENYIQLSADTEQNYIIVAHAPAVAAMLNIFERGIAEIDSVDYCARVIAKRRTRESTETVKEHGVYAAKWDVHSKGMKISLTKPEPHMEKTYEKEHLEECAEAQEMVARRRDKRTNTDNLMESTLKEIQEQHLTKESMEDVGSMQAEVGSTRV